MEYKAVAFCRVSTNQQNYSRQVSDLMAQIRKDGYTEDEIAPPIKHKESATKNDVNNRKTISDLEELIEKHPIEAVYVTEISRLARRGDVLYKVLGMLEEKHISLVVLTPYLIRTYEKKEDGWQKNLFAPVLIAFLDQVAQQEIKDKTFRIKSGYAQKLKEGKVYASKIIFGYKRDKEGFARVDPVTSPIVLQIFQSYLNGDSVTAIWDRYNHRGIFPVRINKTGWNRITKILRDKTYIGENGTFKYPPIIPTDLFYDVQAKMASSIMIKSKLKYVYYCQKLLRYNGHVMTPAVSECVYSYRDTETGKTTGINMNAMDSLLFNLACEARALMSVNDEKRRHENIIKQLESIEQKLNGIEDEMTDKEKKKERIYNAYVNGKSSEDKFLNDTEDVEREILILYNEKDALTITKVELEAVLNGSESGKMQESIDYNTLSSITDDTMRQGIIQEAIDHADVTKTESGVFEIKVYYKDKSLNDETFYRYIQKGCKKYLYCIYGDMSEDWTTSIVERVKRPPRKKSDKHIT